MAKRKKKQGDEYYYEVLYRKNGGKATEIFAPVFSEGVFRKEKDAENYLLKKEKTTYNEKDDRFYSQDNKWAYVIYEKENCTYTNDEFKGKWKKTESRFIDTGFDRV